MIHFNPTTKTFNLLFKTSYYAFQIDPEGHLVHLGWGPRPAGSEEDSLISGEIEDASLRPRSSFETQVRPDEILTFGDVTSYRVTLKVSFPALPKPIKAHEAQHIPIRDVRLRYISHEVVNNAQPGLAPAHGLPVLNSTLRETLCVHLSDPLQAFHVTLYYRLTPEHDILERWCELENAGSQVVTLEVCNFASLHLPNGANELTSLSGAWAREFTTQRQRLPAGTHILESRTLQTSHAANPLILLNRPGQAWEETGVAYFAALAYSGSWRMEVEQLPSWDVRLHAGYNPFDFEIQLKPSERHITPALVCGVSAEGWGGASRRMHAFVMERVLPRSPQQSRFRPVLYNSWEATNFNLSYENQVELARRAAAIGVELFCLDDGWFGTRRSDTAGLGDWVVSKVVFPRGLEPLVAEVHRLGMKFGLWVEPEMVNPDSDLYRQHPDWVLHFPGRPRTEARHQLILDFGRPEVIEYIYAQLDNLVSRYSISFFKWDMNRNVTEPGSVAGKDLWHRHVSAVYTMMDRLRQKHPGLDIQSCSGGGGRIDLGILGRTDQVWVSDNTDAYDRLSIQEGFSLAYPARSLEAWVTHEHNFLTQRSASLGLRFDVAMRGALGIGSSLNELSDEELSEYASYIEFYKRIRHVIQEGNLFRLQRLEEYGASTIEYVLANGLEAIFSHAVRDYSIGSVRPAAPLKGLHSGVNYAIYDRHNREILKASGYELMTLGIPGETVGPAGHSRTLYIRQS